jgi:hypothetical protein
MLAPRSTPKALAGQSPGTQEPEQLGGPPPGEQLGVRGDVELQQHPVDQRDKCAVDLPQVRVLARVHKQDLGVPHPVQAQPIQGVRPWGIS